MPPTDVEEETIIVEAQIPPGFRIVVIGSTSFWHEDSEQMCSDIGEHLAGVNSLVLLTGGVPGVGECVGRSFVKGCCTLGQTASVIHVLPRGCGAWDYGTTLFAGDSMTERREILGRLAKVFVVVEGGPGTEHEANVAAAHGALFVPVARSGGHAGALYQHLVRPAFVHARAWETLGDPKAAPGTVATAVVEIVDSCVRHSVHHGC
jgi:uncharacterized protein (TIGR00725 family)